MLEVADSLIYIVLHLVDSRLEVCQHLLVYLLIEHIDDVALNLFLCQFAILIGKGDFCLCHIGYIARWVDAQYLLASFVGNKHIVNLMVVTKEDDIETRNLAGY